MVKWTEIKGGEKDKTVSLLPERNKEKVENGFSLASPNPKMLNACLKLLLSTNQIHKPLYSTLNLLYTLFLWKHQKEKPKKKKKKKNPRKNYKNPESLEESLWVWGLGLGYLFRFSISVVQWLWRTLRLSLPFCAMTKLPLLPKRYTLTIHL